MTPLPIKKAMIFAAGLGTRLRPLTDDRPKALVEVQGTPLLGHAIERLRQCGIEEILINTHHFADQVVAYLQSQNFGVRVFVSDERDLLLDTGGGLKKASWFFEHDGTFLVWNVDILSDLDLTRMHNVHQQNEAIATLAVQDRPSSRYLLYDVDMRLRGWKHTGTGEVRPSGLDEVGLSPFAFSGIHIIEPDIFRLMPSEDVFSIIHVYLEAASNHTITGFPHTETNWIDVGKRERLEKAEAFLNRLKSASD